MIIECDACTAGPRACADCVVTFLTITPRPDVAAPVAVVELGAGSPAVVELGPTSPPATVELDAAEERALGVLAASGLVPPLRMERAM